MAKYKSIFEELCALFDTQPKKKEDAQAFLKRFMKHADTELEDNDKLWAKMSEDLQNWYNKAVDAMEAKKSVPVPAGMNGGDDDDDEDEPKAKKGKAAKADKPVKKGKRAKSDEDEDTDEDEDKPRKKAKSKANGKAKGGSGVKRERRFEDDQKIVLKVKENPKREGSASYDRFEAYFDKKVKTVGDALKKGITLGDLAWDSDEKRGYIEIR